MKKTEIYPNNEVIYALPPDPIEENEPVCLVDYMRPEAKNARLITAECTALGKIISN